MIYKLNINKKYKLKYKYDEMILMIIKMSLIFI